MDTHQLSTPTYLPLLSIFTLIYFYSSSFVKRLALPTTKAHMTNSDSYRKELLIDSNLTTLDVLDTAGQEEYSAMREQYMRNGDGFLLVYSITSRDSFEEAQQFYNQILRVKDVARAPVVLVSNKCDLSADRQVSTAEGQRLAREWNVPFFESSARYRVNVDEPFCDLVREIRRHQIERHRQGSSSSTMHMSVGSSSMGSVKGRSVREKLDEEEDGAKKDKKACCIIA